MTCSIVVVGSVNADLVLRCDALPLPGQTVHGTEFLAVIGGKGANQAVAAARMGARVTFVGCVGDDNFGRSARERLTREGVDTAHLRDLPELATGTAMVLVDRSGQNCIALAAGANGGLCTDQVDAAAAVIAQARLLICQLESPSGTVLSAARMARRACVPVLLNPAPAQGVPPALLAHVDLLIPNEAEAAVLLGLNPAHRHDPAGMAARLREMGPSTVIITLGDAGVQLADGLGNRHVPALPARVVDTTGAGDAFIGALAAVLSQGVALDTAVAVAQEAASLCVARKGAMDAMAYASELQATSGWDASVGYEPQDGSVVCRQLQG